MLNYTWSFLLGTGSLGRIRSCRRVLAGQKVVLMLRGDRTRLMASEVPLMYGMVVEVDFLRGSQIV